MEAPEQERLPEENDLTPALIRRGVEEYLTIEDTDLRLRSIQPLTAEERRQIADDLLRAPLMAFYADPIRLRGRDIEEIQSISFFIHYLDLRRQGEIDPFHHFSGTWSGVDYTPRSLAAMFYLNNIVATLAGARFSAVHDDSDFLSRYVPVRLWEQDDIKGMHQAYLDTLTYVRYRYYNPNAWRLEVPIARVLLDANAPGYDPLLRFQLERLGLEWQELLQEWEGIAPDQAVTRLREAVAVQERLLFGAGSRASREAVDRNERARGALIAGCDQWSYEELEHWGRWLLRSLTVADLCRIVKERPALFELLGVVELDEPCEQVPREGLLATVESGIRASAKRALCTLLTDYAAFPATVPGTSQRRYNTEVLERYLTPEVVTRLLTEPQPNWERYSIDTLESGGSEAFIDESSAKSLKRTLVSAETGPMRGLVVWDLYRKLVQGTGVTLGIVAILRRGQSSPRDEPRIIMTSIDTPPAHPSTLSLAIVVLRGRLAVSLVSTNQKLTRAGEAILVQDRPGQLLPPQRVVLVPGDLSIATLNDPEGDGSTITPFDLDAFYDLLVLRAEEEGTVWLEYDL